MKLTRLVLFTVVVSVGSLPVRAETDPTPPVKTAMKEAGRGDLDHAIADYNRAIELNPNNAQVYLCRDSLKESEGQFDSALADFDRAIALDPKYVDALIWRGIIKQTEGELAGAPADLDKAIALDTRLAGAGGNQPKSKDSIDNFGGFKGGF